MRLALLPILITFSILSLFSSISSLSTLLQVQVIFRHGERVPYVNLSVTPDASAYFFRGPAELTDVSHCFDSTKSKQNVDAKEHFASVAAILKFSQRNETEVLLQKAGWQQGRELGEKLKAMYVDSGFLDKRMLPSQMDLLSTSDNRALMSGGAMAEGLFPSNSGPAPPAFQTYPMPDYMINSLWYMKHCPPILSTFQQQFKTNATTDPGIIAVLFNMDASQSSVWNDTTKRPFVEQFTAQYDAGLWIPPWMDYDAYYQGKYIFYQMEAQYMGISPNFTRERYVLTNGELLNRITNLMENALNCSTSQPCPNSPKFYAISGHDTTIVGLGYALGQFQIANYTSSYSFELWNIEDQLVVKILFRTGPGFPFSDVSSTTNCYNATMKGCLYQDFQSLLSLYKTPSAVAYCQSLSTSSSGYKSSSMLLLLFLLLFI